MTGNFGFIHEKIEIKILILFILRRVPGPVTFDELTALTMFDDGIGYFDFADCVAELVRTQHIVFEDNKYSLTAKGARNGEITEISLPYSVRLDAENKAYEYRAALDRDSMIKTSRAVNQDGSCTVSMVMSDGIGEMISLDLFAANERQAAKIERGFRKNAENVYKALLRMLG